MMSRLEVHFSSADPTWETPADLFAVLDREFGFELDVCALPATAKCRRFYTPEIDGLAQEWAGVCWMNPPYGREIVQWMRKAYQSAATGSALVVCLVPARTDTSWWWAYARHGEVRLLPGRLKFGGASTGAPFPSAVVIFRPGLPEPGRVVHWDWRQTPREGAETMGKHGMTHSEGLSLAQQIVARLAPACERIEIAGSLRRGKPEVGDIELVAIPRPVLNLFGEPTEHTEITHALASWGVSLTKNGPKYKQFMVGQVQVDLFLATEDNFGLIHMIRTGVADFSRQMVTPKAWGGLLPAGLKVEGGQVWHGAAALSVPDEAALFALWGMAFVEPAARNSAQAVPA